MSFGWSAGDIATAITVVYNLIQALDSCDGATGDYRETVSFLQDLKRTLEPLQTFTAWNAYPAYGREIGEHVGHIKRPVEQFLSAVWKYEPSLGSRAQDGHHRHVVRKLQWHIFMSKKVLGLKKKIESRMRIIDTLMQRLTLDLVWTAQQQLPDTMRAAFQDTLRPELMTILQDCLSPLNSTLLPNYQGAQNMSREAQGSRLVALYEELSSSVEEIKQQINNPKITTQLIESCLRGDCPKTRQELISRAGGSDFRLDGTTRSIDQSSSWTARRSAATTLQESLQEAQVLSRVIQPTRALMPTLLAEYNTSFLDAIGRQPRILPYEYFRSFKVLQAFIQHDFKNLPGSTLVDRGRYLIMSLANNRVLNEYNWESTVVPGTTVAMSLLLQKRFKPFLELNGQHSPLRSYSRTGIWSNNQPSATCHVCKEKILNPALGREVALAQTPGDRPDPSGDDVLMFKRVVQELAVVSSAFSVADIADPPVEITSPSTSHHFVRAFYTYRPTQEMISREGVVPLKKGDMILTYSIETSAEGDGAVLASEASGWRPTNYGEEYEFRRIMS
ncbi:hypothetical protein F4859DRAFT_516194 [Xylaria cf. heliscus]|nr:hypothetical protein F4859DRAFT_516194 [Xylaria cf. heliscus]